VRNAIFPALLVLLAGAGPASAQSLRGSPASLDRQNRVAQGHDFTYLRNRSHVEKFVGLGLLVPVRRNPTLDLVAVSFPYTRPEVKLFIDRLSAQYAAACGEPLVVTSLTRPSANQPRNASPRSVHPTGMALDIRLSRTRACRSWLESTLLALENARVLEATRENRPPHYHVAIYPQQYTNYVAALERRRNGAGETRLASAGGADGATRLASAESTDGETRLASAESADGETRLASAAGADGETLLASADRADHDRYTVGRGDTLWSIARQVGASVEGIKAANGLRTSRIYPGQTLTVPTGSP
jgi:hypothetical protein